jgi:hypothetical protein
MKRPLAHFISAEATLRAARVLALGSNGAATPPAASMTICALAGDP